VKKVLIAILAVAFPVVAFVVFLWYRHKNKAAGALGTSPGKAADRAKAAKDAFASGAFKPPPDKPAPGASSDEAQAGSTPKTAAERLEAAKRAFKAIN